MPKESKNKDVKFDCKQLQKLLAERSAELTRAHRELYQETTRRWQLEKEIKRYRERFKKKVKELTAKLEKALEDEKKLKGFLTICSACKRILDDNEQWNRIEKYIENHSEAIFTHSICPTCSKRLYPQLHDNQEDILKVTKNE